MSPWVLLANCKFKESIVLLIGVNFRKSAGEGNPILELNDCIVPVSQPATPHRYALCGARLNH